MWIPKSDMPLLIEELNLLLSIGEDRPEGAEKLIKQILNQAVSCQEGNCTHLAVELRKDDNWKQLKSTPSPYPMGCGLD